VQDGADGDSLHIWTDGESAIADQELSSAHALKMRTVAPKTLRMILSLDNSGGSDQVAPLELNLLRRKDFHDTVVIEIGCRMTTFGGRGPERKGLELTILCKVQWYQATAESAAAGEFDVSPGPSLWLRIERAVSTLL
jgi:hypothetical protein